MASVLYVYGTLRRNKETIEIPGASLYDLGWYPGLKFGGAGSVVCERIEIPSEDHYDRYEGYNPDDLDRSLYIRKPFFDGFIYEYNREPPLGSKIESGDWLEYIKTRRGGNG